MFIKSIDVYDCLYFPADKRRNVICSGCFDRRTTVSSRGKSSSTVRGYKPRSFKAALAFFYCAYYLRIFSSMFCGEITTNRHRFYRFRVQYSFALFALLRLLLRVARHGKNLQGLNYGVNDQFPQEVMNRRKNLFPILRKARQNQIRAVIKVDKLYINKVLFDPEKNDIDQIIKNLKDKQ